MGSLRTTAQWNGGSKPNPGESEIDWAHEYTNGLILAFFATQGGGLTFGGKGVKDCFGVSASIVDSTVVSWQTSLRGTVLRAGTAASVSTVSFGPEGGIPLPIAASFACVLSYRKTDTTNRSSSGWGVDSAVGLERCHAHMPYSDGTVYFDYGGFLDGSTRVKSAGLTFSNDIWAFTVGSRGMEIWQNGILQASNTATPTRQAGTSSFYLFNGDGAAGADLAEIDFICLYNRQPNTTTLMQQTREPYAILRPIVRKRYFAAPVVVAASAKHSRLLGRYLSRNIYRV